MRSYRQHCPMANHLAGSASDLPCCKMSRANEGVSSGRSATRRSPLSEKLYSCCVISSPALRTYSSSDSSTGASNSSNPNDRATSRKCPNSQLRTRISSGGKSLVPFGGCRSIICLRAFLAFGSTVVTDRPPSLAAHMNRDPRGPWNAGVDAAGAAGRRSSARSVGARSIERDGVDVAANIAESPRGVSAGSDGDTTVRGCFVARGWVVGAHASAGFAFAHHQLLIPNRRER